MMISQWSYIEVQMAIACCIMAVNHRMVLRPNISKATFCVGHGPFVELTFGDLPKITCNG